MSVPSDAPVDPEARAHRRWLITILITVLFGGFGAVMAYLSYVNSSKPSASSPGRSRSPRKAPSATPGAPSTVTPPASEPSTPVPSGDEKGKSDKPKDK